MIKKVILNFLDIPVVLELDEKLKLSFTYDKKMVKKKGLTPRAFESIVKKEIQNVYEETLEFDAKQEDIRHIKKLYEQNNPKEPTEKS